MRFHTANGDGRGTIAAKCEQRVNGLTNERSSLGHIAGLCFTGWHSSWRSRNEGIRGQVRIRKRLRDQGRLLDRPERRL